jgi:hypothetical protein
VVPARPTSQSLFETIELAARQRLLNVSGSNLQLVSENIAKRLDHRLNEEERKQIRLKLDDAGVRLRSLRWDRLPSDEAEVAEIFAFSRQMGVETIAVDHPPGAIEKVVGFSNKSDIALSVSAGHRTQESAESDKSTLEQVRPDNVSLYVDFGEWLRSGTDPEKVLPIMQNRLVTVRIPTAGTPANISLDTVARQLDQFLECVKTLRIKPLAFEIESRAAEPKSRVQLSQYVELLDELSRKHAGTAGDL